MDLYGCQSNQVTSVYDDVSADRSSSMNSEGSDLIRQHFTVQMDNDQILLLKQPKSFPR